MQCALFRWWFGLTCISLIETSLSQVRSVPLPVTHLYAIYTSRTTFAVVPFPYWLLVSLDIPPPRMVQGIDHINNQQHNHCRNAPRLPSSLSMVSKLFNSYTYYSSKGSLFFNSTFSLPISHMPKWPVLNLPPLNTQTFHLHHSILSYTQKNCKTCLHPPR